MEQNDCLYEIELDYNIDAVLKEMERAIFYPFNDLGPNQQGVTKVPIDSWFYNPPSWLQAHVEKKDFNRFPEVKKIFDQICSLLKCDDARPRFYRQLANTHVPMHIDRATLSAVNIQLTEEYAPVVMSPGDNTREPVPEPFDQCEFEIGRFHYNCCLFNPLVKHGVPAFYKDRLLLKFSIFDISYEEALQNVLSSKL